MKSKINTKTTQGDSVEYKLISPLFYLLSHGNLLPRVETLKWGELGYVTTETQSGSTVCSDWKKSCSAECAVYLNCKTTLVETFKAMYGELFHYAGNRGILFSEDDTISFGGAI